LWSKAESFSLRSELRQGCQLSPLLFSIGLEVLALQSGKIEIKGIRKKIKLCLFADGMILYKENLMIAPKTIKNAQSLLELICEFSDIAGYKNNIQAGLWWLMPVILAIWKADIRRIVVQGQPGQIVRFPLQNNQNKMYWRCDSSDRMGTPVPTEKRKKLLAFPPSKNTI
jgi:hypothetical protein